MKPSMLLGAIVVTTLLAQHSAHASEALVAESRDTSMTFMKSLKGALQTAMKGGGPVNAIAVCQEQAPAIAADLSTERGASVGRTSLKPRNPANAPDAWERAVLEKFEARKASGEDPATLEHSEVVEQGGKRVFRYMKAIPTAPVCLNCHGEKLDPAVADKIRELYPRDQATGFSIGDIRGAFTIIRPL